LAPYSFISQWRSEVVLAAIAFSVVISYLVGLASLGTLAERWGRKRWAWMLAGFILSPALGFLMTVGGPVALVALAVRSRLGGVCFRE
jgi:MFS family permease